MELKASELRIGNLVMLNCKVETVNGVHIDSTLDIGYIDAHFKKPSIKDINPILLTEEWLDKFNFKFIKSKRGTQGVYSNGKMNVYLSNSRNVYTSRGKLIPYVHTFQNIYYFTLLTGEEL